MVHHTTEIYRNNWWAKNKRMLLVCHWLVAQPVVLHHDQHHEEDSWYIELSYANQPVVMISLIVIVVVMLPILARVPKPLFAPHAHLSSRLNQYHNIHSSTGACNSSTYISSSSK